MDVSIGSFKIKLFKAPAITNIPPPPPPQPKKKKNNVEVPLDHFCPRLNKIDQNEMKGGVLMVPIRKIGSLWVRKYKILNTFCPRL